MSVTFGLIILGAILGAIMGGIPTICVGFGVGLLVGRMKWGS